MHYRFDQEAGAELGRDIATYVYKHNLRGAKHFGDRDDATMMMTAMDGGQGPGRGRD